MVRERCERCARPLTHCLCALIPSLPNETRVLLLQHPDETRHALNSARFVTLGLQRIDCLMGERFPELEQAFCGFSPLLLFPGEPAVTAPQWRQQVTSPTLLVVIDGTWRKARKILHLNPALQHLPRLHLAELPQSRYRLRKSSQPGSLATVEAVVAALSVLEDGQGFEALLQPFEAMIEAQIRAMGEETFRRNHQKQAD